MSEVRRARGGPSFEVNLVDERILVRDPRFGAFDGWRVVEVIGADGPSSWTSWEVVTPDGEHFAVLATRYGAHGAVLLGSWPLPRWMLGPADLLGSCRTVEEAKAWLGAFFPPPANWDASWWLAPDADGDEEDGGPDPDAPYEYGSWRTESGTPRLLPSAELPDGTDAHFDYLALGLAGKLPPLDITGHELLAAATWTTTLYDPVGLDQDGAQGWRVVASVWWAGRQALLVGEWEGMEGVQSDPGQMTFRLLAPATPAEAEQVALGKITGGVPMPSFEWLYRKEATEPARSAAPANGGQP